MPNTKETEPATGPNDHTENITVKVRPSPPTIPSPAEIAVINKGLVEIELGSTAIAAASVDSQTS